MKKLPRNLSGSDLENKLRVFGYIPTRQVGSHIRLTTEKNGIHHITIPNHSSLRIGTLAGILKDISNHLKISKKDLLEQLF